MLDPAYHMTQLVRAWPSMTQVDEEICTGRVMAREKALEDLQVSVIVHSFLTIMYMAL
jgi:hypothetical protein